MAKKKHPVFSRKLRMGMVGGGPGAFIGDVHRRAAVLDGQIELVAGAFSRDPEKSRRQGKELFLDASRTYASYQDMIKGEKSLPDTERIDFVSVVTPNDSHFAVARDFLKAGFSVVLDKPMTLDVKQARSLKKIVDKSDCVFALTHNYTGYPMVKLARDLCRKNKLGAIRKVVVQYPQGWLTTAIEKSGMRQAAWRTDPARSGAAGCFGDIGSHAENLAEYITGLTISEICADLTTFVKGRRLDDDGSCLLRFSNGAKGILSASQISIGEENGLAIRAYGEKASVAWRQETPNTLEFKTADSPMQVWKRGNDYVGKISPAAMRATRLPAGHPEAFFEAFATIYANFSDTLRASIAGIEPDPLALDFPTVDDGLRGMLFIDTVVKSSRSASKWLKIPKK